MDVREAAAYIVEARTAWGKAKREADAAIAAGTARVIHEMLADYRSVEEIARALGVPPHIMRAKFREHGLRWGQGRSVLADHAAKALRENTELLGIEIAEMDLMSPLAYLPAGSVIREALREEDESE